MHFGSQNRYKQCLQTVSVSSPDPLPGIYPWSVPQIPWDSPQNENSANAVFAKFGHVASKEVTLQLMKCLPVLLYGLEACPLTKSDLQSLDFVINWFFIKLFTTKNIDIVKYCQEYFGFALPSALWAKRVSKFELSFKCFLSAL